VEGDVAMTAFVLAALAECKCGVAVCELQSVNGKMNITGFSDRTNGAKL